MGPQGKSGPGVLKSTTDAMRPRVSTHKLQNGYRALEPTGRCNREKPPCKYFHPPQHLKDQLLINGRNHLALKNALMQQMGISPGQPVLPGQVPAVNGATVATTVATAVPPAAAAALGFTLAWGTAPPPPYTTYVATNPYLASMPASTYSPYFQPGHLVPTLLGPVSDPSSVSQLGPVVQQAVVSTQQKIPRSDRLELRSPGFGFPTKPGQ
uniref:Muscleblind-like CCCH zinc finger domain-containing protein n=1 Tax=Anopheles merus TaxID=30066 RepID=A0A182VG58_ANOME